MADVNARRIARPQTMSTSAGSARYASRSRSSAVLMASAASSTCAAQRTSRGCRADRMRRKLRTRPGVPRQSGPGHSATQPRSPPLGANRIVPAMTLARGCPPACGPPARVFVAPLRPRPVRPNPPHWSPATPPGPHDASCAGSGKAPLVGRAPSLVASLPCAWKIPPPAHWLSGRWSTSLRTARAAMSALPSASKSVARSRATSWSPGWSSRAFCKTKHASSARPIPQGPVPTLANGRMRQFPGSYSFHQHCQARA